ncbi:DUF239 domain-containing protein, partial [Cephalotus follicularis]
YDTRCPGFVTTHSKIILGAPLDPISKLGGQIFVLYVQVLRDRSSGNWWCYYGKDRIPIGYWPKSLFSELAGPATYTDWGGQAFSPPGTPGPQMGSGLFPDRPRWGYHAFSCCIKVTDDKYTEIDVIGSKQFNDHPDWYGVKDMGLQHDPRYRHLTFWGGKA